MKYSEFSQLVMNRQSCRAFNDKPILRETVEQIVDLARFSPSACNAQPWQMYVVCGDKLSAVTEALTDGGRNAFLSKAKAYVVLSEKAAPLKEDVVKRYSLSHFIKYDVGELAAYLTLTAESMGVASIIIGWVNGEKIKKAVGLSEKESCSLVVALGYSDAPIRDKTRKEKNSTIVFVD